MSDRAGDAGTSPTLLGRLRLDPRDESAWSDFAARYGRMIAAWCRHWGLQPTDADDLAQNVMLQLLRQMRRFEYDTGGSFRAWLKTVAYRAWCDYLQQVRRRGDQGSGDSAVLRLLGSVEARDDFLTEMEREWNLELLSEAIRRVRHRVQPHTWDAFRLMTREGLSGAQVAEQLQMKVGAVWVAKSKVQRMIQEEIRDLETMEKSAPDLS